MIHLRLFSLSLILLVILKASIAQQPFFEVFDLEQQENGLQINILEQSAKDYLLIGTNMGLFTFDGFTFQAVPSSDSVKHDIRSIYQDSRSGIWFGCANGLILKLSEDSLQPFISEEGYPSVPITAISETSDSIIWFGTYGEGIYYWDGKRQYNINTDDGLPDNYIYDITGDDLGNCWAGTDRGLVKCSIKKMKKEVRIFGIEQGLNDLIVKSLSSDSDGRIWFGTYGGGIGNIDPGDHNISISEHSRDWNFGSVEKIINYGNIIWAGTAGSGIVELNPASGKIVNWSSNRKGQVFNKISDLLQDNQKNIWAASYGLLIRSGGRAYEYIATGTIKEPPAALLVDKRKNLYFANNEELWFSPNDNGVCTSPVKVGLSSIPNSIISLYEDVHGLIWIGTFGDGIIIYDPVNKRDILIDDQHGLINGNVLSIDGHSNIIWLATLEGAERIMINGNDGIFNGDFQIDHFGRNEGLANNFVYRVFIDSRDRVWFGTDGNGLFYFDNEKIHAYMPGSDLDEMVIYSIAEDHNGHIWFSTAEHGIFSISDTIIHPGLNEGVLDGDIRGILTDREGKLIIAYGKRIDVFNTSTGHHLNISNDMAQALEGLNMNALFMQGNEAYFGTPDFIFKVNTSLMPYSFKPPSVITGLKVYNERLSLKDNLSLKPQQNYLSFDYTGIWFMDPSLVKYKVFLEGNDIEWQYTDNRTASYAKLAPGYYTFRVRTSIDGSFKDASEASISFSIARPFTSTIWFYLLLTLGIISLVLLIIKIREKNVKRIQNLETEKILFEFETLKSQVNPHFLFNSFSTLASLIEENRNMAVDYVQKLSEFFRNILDNRDKDLILLEEELKLVEHYIDIQKKRFGDSLIVVTDVSDEILKTLVPPLVLQLLIENAIKHNIISPSKPLEINIYSSQDKLFIKNKLQKKLDDPASTGLGLDNIRRRYDLLAQKRIRIIKDDKSFIVELPIIKR